MQEANDSILKHLQFLNVGTAAVTSSTADSRPKNDRKQQQANDTPTGESGNNNGGNASIAETIQQQLQRFYTPSQDARTASRAFAKSMIFGFESLNSGMERGDIFLDGWIAVGGSKAKIKMEVQGFVNPRKGKMRVGFALKQVEPNSWGRIERGGT